MLALHASPRPLAVQQCRPAGPSPAPAVSGIPSCSGPASSVCSPSSTPWQQRSQRQRHPWLLAARQRRRLLAVPAPPAAAAAAAGNAPNSSAPRGPVVVVDNYDSFTYNLCQYLGDLGCEFAVFPNDAKTVDEIRKMNPRGVLVSPGPGRPEGSGISLEIIEKLGPEGFPIFGVCMGHQCIGQVFGGHVVRAPCGVMHGKTSPVWHTGVGLLEGVASPFNVARYHSLVIDKDTCPPELEVTAWCDDGTIMAVRHRSFPHIQGVQFHPESIITDHGKRIVANFVASLDP